LYEQSQNEPEQTNESSDDNVEDVSFEEVSDEETK
jgi:hypothetical protein